MTLSCSKKCDATAEETDLKVQNPFTLVIIKQNVNIYPNPSKSKVFLCEQTFNPCVVQLSDPCRGD